MSGPSKAYAERPRLCAPDKRQECDRFEKKPGWSLVGGEYADNKLETGEHGGRIGSCGRGLWQYWGQLQLAGN